MPHLTLVQAINDALRVALDQDSRVVVMGQDVGVDGGVFRATEGLLEAFGSERVIDAPLSEAGIVGTSIGMAAYGLRPVSEIQFSGFMPMAFDQIVCHAARLRWRSRGRYTCPLVLRAPYGAGIHPPEHHSESPEAYYAHTPGLKVVMPATPYDAKGLLLAAIHDPDPVIFLEPKRIYRASRQDVPEERYEIPLGRAAVVHEGTDVTLVAFGAMVSVAQRAFERAQRVGSSVELIDLRTVRPLDADTVIASVTKTGRCVVVQEAPRAASVASELLSLVHERAFDALKAPVERVCGFDTCVPLLTLEDHYVPSSDRIFAALQRTLAF